MTELAFLQHIGRRVREERERQGITSRALATRADCGPASLRGIEDGHFGPPLLILRRIAQVLGVPVRNLLPEEPA